MLARPRIGTTVRQLEHEGQSIPVCETECERQGSSEFQSHPESRQATHSKILWLRTGRMRDGKVFTIPSGLDSNQGADFVCEPEALSNSNFLPCL